MTNRPKSLRCIDRLTFPECVSRVVGVAVTCTDGYVTGMPSASRSASFATTHWSLVLASGRQSRAALEALCQAYWPPVFAFIRRQGGDAEDLTQAFFARLLATNLPAKADPARGRFRAFLLASVRNFLHNERDRAKSRKHGGSAVHLDISRVPVASRTLSAERLFERQWALTLLEQVMARLRADYAKAGKAALFDELKATLTGGDEPLAAIAQRLGLTANAAKVAAHRLRKRYRDLLKLEVARTLSDPDEVDDEIRQLFQALEA